MSNVPDDPQESNTAPKWLVMSGGILAGLLAGLAILWLFNQRPGTTSPPPAAPAINDPAPDFELQTLDGQAFQLSASNGTIRVLNFWATWCGPCQVEMPMLEEFQERYGERITILAVNNNEAEDTVRSFVKKTELDLAVLLDPDAKVTGLYRVRGFPTTVFIDSEGVIRYQHLGLLNRSTLQGYLDDLGASQ